MLLGIVTGCGGGNSIDPSCKEGLGISSLSSPEQSSNRHLWGLWTVSVDPDKGEVSISPNRSLDTHLNATKMLETGSCNDCLSVSNLKKVGTDEINIDITLKHPFKDNLRYTGFDVRGVFITNGTAVDEIGHTINYGPSNTGNYAPRLLNYDGYVELYNASLYPQDSPDPPIYKYWKGKYANAVKPTARLTHLWRTVKVTREGCSFPVPLRQKPSTYSGPRE
jgi:hypothetical protein